jgi:alkyl sulfatase BDS1-like metallo-beta-lactamase superfamily hydrolase
MTGHFHPLGTLPSPATVSVQAEQRGGLPFDDERDFAEARRGFLVAPGYRQSSCSSAGIAHPQPGNDHVRYAETR